MEYFKRKSFLPNYKIEDKNNDKIIISTIIAYDDEILQIVKYWLPFIKIIEPLSLREKFTALLQNYLDEIKA